VTLLGLALGQAVKARALELASIGSRSVRRHPPSTAPSSSVAGRRLRRYHGLPRACRADRLDPARLLPGCRSVVAVAVSYNGESRDDSWRPVSRYARGRDYHDVMRPRLVALGEFIGAAAGGNVTSRAAVDSSAVLERDLAARRGSAGSARIRTF